MRGGRAQQQEKGKKGNHVDGCAAAAACSGQACTLYVGANSRQEAGSRHDRRLQPCVGEALDSAFSCFSCFASLPGEARRGISPSHSPVG